LFASIFAFVTSFPSPPPQNNNQFQASLVYGSNSSGMYVAGVHILHLAGPVVPGSALVYLKSSVQPNAPEFQSPYTVSSGLSGASAWNLGQVWNLTFSVSQRPIVNGNNITVYLVSGGQLLFSVILPGSGIAAPPTVTSTWISPANPYKGQAFTVYATLSGSYLSNSVFVNLAAVPNTGALNTAHQMTQNAQGQWTYPVAAGVTNANGTYFGFVNATSSLGVPASGAVVITISNTGGSAGSPITVGVVVVPQPPSVIVGTSYFAAVVSYTGSLLNKALNVSFWANITPHAPFTTSHSTYQLYGPAVLSISGPSTVTVYATSPSGGVFPNIGWDLNSTVWVNASATIAGVGSASGGSNAITTPNYIPGVITATSSTATSSCVLTKSGTSTLCPFLNVTVWENWTTALGGPPLSSSITFSGVVWIVWGSTNNSANQQKYTIGSTALSTSPVTVNAVTGTTTGTTRWQPKSGTSSSSYVAAVTLVVYSGTTVIGFIYDTVTGT
jgi:hypothetical protein